MTSSSKSNATGKLSGEKKTASPRVTPSRDDEAFRKLGETRVVTPGESDATPVPEGPLQADPKVGSLLGDYRLLEKLGEGAMGAVYRAVQLSSDRVVALKILFNHVANNPNVVERLNREGQVLGQLDHPNIIQAYDRDEARGCHYLAMEFVAGRNLQAWLKRVGQMSVADAVHVTLTIAQALDYAHQQGVVHRDIKPENVLITSKGKIKVGDFGMVKVGDEEMSLTQTGHGVGTPWYMSPEQARNSKEADGRCDIYSLGCLLYCLLTGHPPFRGRTIVEVIEAKEIGTFAPARSVNPEVPQRLDLIILKMTAKRVKDRYQTCAEVVQDLEALQVASKRLAFLGTVDTPAAEGTPLVKAGRTLIDTPTFDPNIWHVRLPASKGKHTVRKLTTEQIKAMVEVGKLPPTTQASHDAAGGFRALSAYKEFATALAQASKQGADESTSRYRELYQKIKEEDQQRASEEPAEAEASTVKFWIATILEMSKLPLAILFVLVLLVLFLWWATSGLLGS